MYFKIFVSSDRFKAFSIWTAEAICFQLFILTVAIKKRV